MRSLVIGGARSGLAACLYLKKRNHEVILIDSKTLKPEYKKTLISNNILFYENTSTIDLSKIDRIIPSPGVPLDIPIIKEALAQSIPVISELDLALSNYTGKIISVTGTNGKSTVSSMIHHILNKLDPSSLLGGNFEIPPCELFLDESKKSSTTYLVLEVSSYQAELSTFNSDVCVFTSFSQDHLKRHKTMENYFKAKWKLVENLKTKKESLLLLSSEVYSYLKSFNIDIPSDLNYKIIEDILDDIPTPKDLHLSKIDTINAKTACLAASFVSGSDPLSLIEKLFSYHTLEHRLEFVKSISIVDQIISFINDSKSTNCDTVCTALKNYPDSILLLGGESKKEDFSPIIPYINKISCIIFFGQDRNYLLDNLKSSGFKTPYLVFDTLKETLEPDNIRKIILEYPSKYFLFSPGCASFDEFENFEHRGRFFKEQISKLY